LQSALPLCASVLVKGSRFMRMERAIERMQTQALDLAHNTLGESVHAA